MLKITTAIAASLFLSSPLSAVQEGSQPGEIEVGICVTSTQFYARNFSSTNQVLFFKGGLETGWRTLAPGCDISWSYPTQVLGGISLEVANYSGGTWLKTGSIALDSLAARGADALWVQGDAGKTSWFEIGSQLFVEQTGASIFPSSLSASTSVDTVGELLLMAPIHVPVITPGDDPEGDVPPVIRERPLPPV